MRLAGDCTAVVNLFFQFFLGTCIVLGGLVPTCPRQVAFVTGYFDSVFRVLVVPLRFCGFGDFSRVESRVWDGYAVF